MAEILHRLRAALTVLAVLAAFFLSRPALAQEMKSCGTPDEIISETILSGFFPVASFLTDTGIKLAVFASNYDFKIITISGNSACVMTSGFYYAIADMRGL